MTVLPTQRGHGFLGGRTNQRTFEQLVALPVYDKRVLVEARPGTEVGGWTLDELATYVTVFDPIFRDARLDVVAVRTLLDEGLVKVETLDDCKSIAGTFFFDAFDEAVGVSPPNWDDGFSLWDAGLSWDQAAFLYVHLFENADPNATRVRAQVGFHLSNKATIEATFGEELIQNGSFEDGDPAGIFAPWFPNVPGNGDAGESFETENPIRGTASYRIALNSPTTNSRRRLQTFNVKEGVTYRVSMLYQLTEPTPGAGAQIHMSISPQLTPTLRVDALAGRDVELVVGLATLLADPTFGETRRMTWDFISPFTGPMDIRIGAQAPASAAGVVLWDDAVTLFDDGLSLWDDFGSTVPFAVLDEVSIRPIWRFNYHEPRLDAGQLPQLQTGSRDIYFQAQQIGSGSISFANGDGYFDEALAQFDWESGELFIRVGGAFVDGEELLIDDFATQFKGVMRRDQDSDTEVRFDLEDVRTFILQQVPVNVFSQSAAFPALDPALEGSLRRVWFGEVANIPPVRVDLTVRAYPIFELADPTVLPNGITSVDQARSYPSSSDANEDVNGIVMVEGVDFTVDLAEARITILRDVQVIEVTEKNRFIDWDQGGPPLVAQLPLGFFTPRRLRFQISIAMNAVAGADKSVVYNENLHIFNFSKLGGTFNLLTQSGANKSNAIFSTIGFETGVDRTGALSYAADDPIFVLGDDLTKHHVRVDGVGARDTIPGGDFTGVSGDPIEKGADITRVLWTALLNQPSRLIDDPSFAAARSLAPEALGIYLDAATTGQAVFQKLQNSNRANIVIDGEGIIRYIVNQPGVAPPGTPSLEDADLISFEMKKALDDVYSRVRILHARNPSTGQLLTQDARDTSTEILFNRSGVKDFETFLVGGNDAALRALSFLSLSSRPLRVAELTIKGLVEKVEGEKVFITRQRGVSGDGVLTNELFRILLVRKSPESATVELVAVEDV